MTTHLILCDCIRVCAMQLSEIAIRLYSNVSSDRGVFDVCNHQKKKMPPISPIHAHWNIIGLLPDVNRILLNACNMPTSCLCMIFVCQMMTVPNQFFINAYSNIYFSEAISEIYNRLEWAFAWLFELLFFLNFRHVLPTLHLFWRKNFQKLVFWLNYVQNPSCYMIYSYRVEKRKQAKSLLICCYTDLLTLSHQLVGLNDLWFLTNLIAVAILICSSLFC